MKLLKITSKGRQYGDRALVQKIIRDMEDQPDVCPLREARDALFCLRNRIDEQFKGNDRAVFWYHFSQLMEADYDASVGEWRDYSEYWPTVKSVRS
ncbi:MAG: hypothetical protein SGJ27_26775 [Candidatus Melainabacteria bacterium]|nr:hypothetical protein [Candidatus Melainabacteria bacterium]